MGDTVPQPNGASLPMSQVQNMARTLLAGASERLGVFYLSVFKMLASDVTVFIFLFCIFLLNYGAAMYISYPRAGKRRQHRHMQRVQTTAQHM